MKLTLVLLIVAAFVGCDALSWSCTDDSWTQYKSTYNKNYPDSSEDLTHHDIYCNTLKAIDEHNAKFQKGEVSDEQGVNQFTDMSTEEFSAWVG